MITKRIIMKNLRKLGFLHVMVMVFILAFLASAPPWAHAQIPRYINYQGKLTDIDDNPVTGDVSVTVRLYDAESEGTALWTETQSVTATRGIFSILLGNTTALDDLDFNSAYWYSVEVESDGEMTPRQRLTAVGYAMNTDTLDGYDSSDFLKTSPSGDLSLTGGANEDIEINPTGTGNVIITIDSTSGDFKVTDGTTNWLLVDHATGNVTIAQDLTVGGTIYGSFASEDGDSTFTTITVTGASDLRGNIASSTGVVTIADTLTQTGASNQVTLAGNLDANNGVDVTGALTVSGATTLSSALDANANIDLDYSGASAALAVTQASTGAAAQFTGGRVLVGTDTSNAYALSTGELYVQGDLEVDGTIYGNINGSGSQSLGATTLSSLTVTGASDLQGNVADSAGTYTIADNIDVTPVALTSGGTDDYALNIAQTLNDTGAAGGSDVYRGVKINVTQTDTTGWDNVYLMDLQVDEASKLRVDNSGNVTVSGTVDGVDIAALKTAADLDYDAIGDLPTAAVTDGATTTIATGDQIYDFVTGEGYITNDTSIAKGDLANSGTLGFDWADDEVADTLTLTAGSIDGVTIGATTPAAATVTNLTFDNSGSATIMTFEDNDVTNEPDTLVYDSTAARELYFSGSMSAVDFHVRGSSPAVLSFGSDAAGTSLIYDPATDEIRFSRGTFAQDFRNLVKNGSFESFSSMEEFHDYDMGYATAAPEGTAFGGVWDKTDGFQGGWENFAPDDWDYVSGDVFQHAPLFFKQDFVMTDIGAEEFKEDFTEGKSAVRLGYIDDAGLAGPPDLRPGKISQTISGLKPSAVYSVGVKVRVEYTLDGQNNKIPAGTATIDIEGEDGGNTDPADNTTTQLSATLNASDTIVEAVNVADFPPFGTILLETENIRYEGLDDTTTPQRFLKCTRAANGTNAEVHETTGVAITLAAFPTAATSTDVEFVKLEGRFCTDPMASDITIVLSAEAGSAYFDTVQLVAGGTVPEYTPNSIVATGDQALYGSFAIRRSSDEKGGILSVDKFVRTRGIELFSDDPGFSGAIGGGGMNVGGGGGIFPPGQGWNEIDQQQPAIQLYTKGDYSANAPQVRDYKVTIDNDAGTTFKWYYMDDTTGWDYASTEGGWAAGNEGNSIGLSNDSANYIALDYGVEVCFSDTTGAKGDTWWFNASNETFGQGDFYGEENTYVHGKTRIYVDPDPFSPYFNQMVFEDGATRVSLGDLAGTVETGASFTNPSSMGMLGSLSLDVSGAYNGDLGDIQYEVEISSEGEGATPDSFYYRIKSADVWGGYSEEVVISGNSQNVGNGLFVSFWEPDYNFLNGVVGDKWTFNAYAGVAAESKVSTLNNRSGDLILDPGSNITIDYPEAGKIRIAATVADGDASATNEIQDLWATISSDNGDAIANATTDTLTIAGSGIASTAIVGDTLTITATEADTLQSVTDRIDGAITTNSIAVTHADGIVIGEDKTGPNANTAGKIKLFSAGDNALYTTFTAGIQTDNADYILPTASTNGLLKNAAGTLSWDGTAYITGVAWSEITGTLSNQTDLSDALALKAPLADPAFTGVPTAPTATAGDSDTSIATTAFVDTAVQTGIAGLSWKEAALSLITENDTTVPPDETLGNRYVLSKDGGVPHADWDGAAAGDMVQFNGTIWVKESPQDGDAVFIEDVDTGYVYTGTAWTPFTGASAYTWGTGLAADGNRIDTVDAEIDHNELGNYEATEHVNWAAEGVGTIDVSNYVDNTNDTVIGIELDGTFSTTGLLKRTGVATYATITDSSADWGTAYTHSQDTSQAHSDYLLNTADAMGGTLTIATATPSDLVIDNTTVGTPDGGNLASDSGKIILRGNFFNDTGDSDTPIDMSMNVDITDASTYKISFFDDSADPTEIASLDQAGALQIDGDAIVSGGAIDLGSAANQAGSIVLYDGDETGGETLTIQPSAIADDGSWTMKLPAAIASGESFLKMGADGVIDYDESTYATGNDSISLTGDVAGTGTTSIATTIGANKVNDTHIDWGTGANQVSADDIGDGATKVIITSDQETEFGTAYTHSQDTSQAHSDYLLNTADAMGGTLTIATATPSDLVIDNTTVGTPDGGNLASDSGAIILRGNYFNDTGDSDTPIDMSLKMDVTDAATYKLSFFDNTQNAEIASLGQGGNLQIDGDATISGGNIDLGVGDHDDLTADDITDLTDGDATTLHIHESLTPGAHAASHHSGGGDALAFDSLADGTTYKKFLDTEKTKLTGIETAADVTDATNVASAGAIMASYASAQTIQPTGDVVPLTIKGKASASSKVLSVYDAAASPAEKIYVGSEGQMYIAEDTSAGAKDSTAILNFGRNATDDWETMGYDPTLGTKGMFTFSAPLEVEASSPTGITFVEKDAQGNITQSQGFMYDPDKDEFSFTGGTLQQSFQNLVRGGDFETYRPSGWYSYYSSWNSGYYVTPSYKKFGDKSLCVYDSSATSTKFLSYYIDAWNRLRGKNITLSVWARCASGTTDASIGISTTYSQQATAVTDIEDLTTTWKNFSVTYTVPTDATNLKIFLYATPGTNGMPDVSKTTGGGGNIYYDGVTVVEGNMAMPFGPSPIFDTGDQRIGGSLAIGADSDPYDNTYGGQYYYRYPRLIFGEPDQHFGGYYDAYSYDGTSYYNPYGFGTGEISFRSISSSAGRFMFNRPIGMDTYEMQASSWDNTPALFIGNLVDHSWEGGEPADSPDYAWSTRDAFVKGVMEVRGGIYGDVMSDYGGVGRTNNMLKYSEDFNQSDWTKTGQLWSGYQAPDGTYSAFKMDGYNEVYQYIYNVDTYTDYTFSVFLKPDIEYYSYGYARISLKPSYTSDWYTWPNYKWCDIETGTGWRRFSITVNSGSGTSVGVKISDMYNVKFWGAQLRSSASPGIYVRTEATPVTSSTSLFHGDGSGLTNLPAGNMSGTAGITGVSGTDFEINEDATSGEDMALIFNRGATGDAVLIWDESGGSFGFNKPLQITNNNDLTVAGQITAGTGSKVITTALGNLDATKLAGIIAAGRLPSDGYASTYVNVGSDTMTGKLTINETATANGAQALDINSTGVMASSANKIISSVSDNAAHTTTGSITGLEVTLAGAYNNASTDATALSIDLTSITGTSGTEKGIDIQMGVTTDSAINTNAKIVAGMLSDGTANISGGSVSGVSSITTGTLNVTGSSTFTGDLDVGGGYTGTSGGGVTLEADGDIYFDGDMYQTGDVYTVDTVRFTGNYDVGLVSKFGVGASGGDADYLQINADGYLLDMDDPVTINDALSQTGAGQVTLSGNVDVQSGIDVTGGNLTIDTNDLLINTSKFTVDGATGNTSVAGTLGVTGNVDVSSGLDVTGANLTLDSNDLLINTSKFTVDGATGNTIAAGTLGVTGNVDVSSGLDVTGANLTLDSNDLLINTNKFTIDGLTGNTSVGGTLGVTGAATFNGAMTLGDNGDTVAIDSSDWDISTTGVMTGIGAITMDGNLTGSATLMDIDKAYANNAQATASNTYTDHVLTRSVTGNVGVGNTWTVNGPVMTIDISDTQTAGTLIDNSTLLKLKTGANVGAVGYFIDAQNSTGTSKFSVNAAGTGNFAGDLSVTGDLNVSGDQVISGTTLYDSATTVRVNNASAFLVEKANVTTAGTGYDVLVIDTTGANNVAGLVGINTTPASGVELDVAGDADFSGTLKAGTSDAFAVGASGNVTLVNNATLDGVDISDFATSGSLDHAKLTNIGTNTHTAIDSHIAATGTSVHSLGTISTQAANDVTISGGSITGISALGVTSGAVSVDAGQKLNVEGSAGDTYMQFNSTTGKLEIYVNNEVVAYIKN